MKKITYFIFTYIFLINRALCSGYEYHETIAGTREIGIVNFRHISTGEYQGKLMFEPLGTMSFTFRGETLLILITIALVLTILIAIYFFRIFMRKRKNISTKPAIN